MVRATMPSASSEPSPWESGLQGARANLWPGLVLQAVALILVGCYYEVPAVNAALARLMEFRGRVGLGFPVVSTALCGGLLPYLYLRRSAAYDAKQGAFLVLFWAYKGIEVDLLYRFQAYLFGTGHGAATLGAKVAVDQFIYSPLLAVPGMTVAYGLMDSHFNGSAVAADWRRPHWYRRRVLPVLISNIGIWLPAVAIIYLLPTPLQLPLENLVLCFYTLVLAYQSRAAPVAAAAAAGPA